MDGHQVSASSSRTAKRTPAWAGLAYVLVLVMTLYAFAVNSITFATNDCRAIVLQAVGVAALASLLVVVLRRRVPPAGRVMLGFCAIADLWTLFDAGGRRLPAVIGW
ncbi:MAG: hypothetical protein HY812_04265 [Planctomycetes bacterium]|nr:hypothetical protein [Planctomycetota bacterium]